MPHPALAKSPKPSIDKLTDSSKLLKKDDDQIIEKENEEEEDKGEEESFTRMMFKKFGIEITERGTTIITYMVAYHSFLQSYWRVVF